MGSIPTERHFSYLHRLQLLRESAVIMQSPLQSVWFANSFGRLEFILLKNDYIQLLKKNIFLS